MSEIASFIDTIIDDFVITRKKPKANFTQFLRSQEIDRRTINDFIENKITFVTDQIEELNIALNGEDLVVKEGYSNFRRPELRDFKDLLGQIVDDLYSYKESKRIVRRKRKVTPDKIVKYIKLSDQKLELNGTTYSSLPAEQLVGAKHIFLYNIEKRELTYYTGRSLSIRRTVVDGFDKSKSWSRTLRKPEQFLSDIVSCTKFNVENIGDNLTTKPKIPSGRIVSKQILIKVIS